MPQTPLFTDAFYLTAIDFETGETVFKRLAGTGLRYDNNYSPVTIGPDGTAYVGTVNGLLAIRDGSPHPPLTGWSAILQDHTPAVGLALALLSLVVVWALDRLLFGRRRRGDHRTDPRT
jgi:hypothetical protein